MGERRIGTALCVRLLFLLSVKPSDGASFESDPFNESFNRLLLELTRKKCKSPVRSLDNGNGQGFINARQWNSYANEHICK